MEPGPWNSGMPLPVLLRRLPFWSVASRGVFPHPIRPARRGSASSRQRVDHSGRSLAGFLGSTLVACTLLALMHGA